MGQFSNIISMKNGAIEKQHFLTSFMNTNTVSNTEGQGSFYWIATGSLPSAVAGIIVLPTVPAGGYFKRMIEGNVLTPEMFGATGKDQTMQAQGLSQGQADAIYGAAFCDVTADTWDWAALQSMFNYMKTSNYRSCSFQSKDYYLNKTVYLPTLTSASRFVNFEINGNDATIRPLSSLANYNFTFFKATGTDYTNVNDIQTSRRFHITSLNFLNSDTYAKISTSKGLEIIGSYGSLIENCSFKSFGTGLSLKFALQTYVVNCKAQACAVTGFYCGVIETGEVSGSFGIDQVQSNCTTFQSCYVGGRTGATTSYGFHVAGCNGVMIRDYIIEQAAIDKGVYFDSQNSSTVKEFALYNGHIEADSYTTAAIYIKGGDNLVCNIDRVFRQGGGVLIAGDPAYGSVFIDVSNIPYIAAGAAFAHKGSASAAVFWDFTRVAMTNDSVYNAANWKNTGGYAVPVMAQRQTVNGDTKFKVPVSRQNNASGGSARVWEYNTMLLTTIV